MLRVLTLSSLFPDSTRPNFGIFVERQTLGLAAQPDVAVRAVAPVGLPPGPLRLLPRFRQLAGLPRAETWKGLTIDRPRFTVYPGTQGRLHVPSLTRALVPLLDAIRRDFAFDVIDASFFFPDGPAAVALGRRYGVPVSIKARGADIHFWGRQGATAAQVRRAGQEADGLLAVSSAMRDDMIGIGLPADRIRVHHTGVDLDRFAPIARAAAKQQLGISGPLVISVGALIERKGHEIVVEAVARLPGVSLIIAGEGPARGRIEAAAARLGLADRVRLLGAVPHEDLPRLIAAADVMALASASEGLANAWMEALACGTPVVITPAGGAHEVVTGPAAGRVVPRDAAAFAAAIADVLRAPPSAEATRSHAASFTWPANAQALREHLHALVVSRQPEP
ncbi:glycosyltransferase [Sphingomonas mucosissima]|uniref:Putative teichuronic acid biosynthesis glycosyltransferase TuaC n=1 Tax=Sphingomonas mucosissima TaxID=370959 RepID=A0A245ZG14_9SPHN|nr:glycosyltransferase [Sphingomonas mucosissima]OWK28664.1 putative teichuronic acid biosynthesis glycosyltransferase TuaC [Sphingomonas mucosissima]